MTNGLCLNDLCGGHYLSRILILLHCIGLTGCQNRPQWYIKYLEAIIEVKVRIIEYIFLLASTLMKIDSIRSRIGES